MSVCVCLSACLSVCVCGMYVCVLMENGVFQQFD